MSLWSRSSAPRGLDVGRGTGTFALMLADRRHHVVAVDPASASLTLARAKPGRGARRIDGDATALPVTDRDVATMTGNVVQSIAHPEHCAATMRSVRAALQPGGHLVFETRDPAARGWQPWTREASYRTTEIAGVGAVTSWVEVTARLAAGELPLDVELRLRRCDTDLRLDAPLSPA